MIFTITVFFFAISLCFALIARKIWQFRSGRILPDSYEPADWTDLSIERVRERLLEISKFTIHHTVLIMLKVWIKTAHWIRMMDRKIKMRLTHLLHRNGHLPEGGKPSEFLNMIQAHKEEVAEAMEKESEEGL